MVMRKMERREIRLAEATPTPGTNPLDIFLCLFPRIKNETPFPRLSCITEAGTPELECCFPRMSCITQSLQG